MKFDRFPSFLALAIFATIGMATTFYSQLAAANTYTWDASGNDGSPSFDGAGTWGTASNWWTGSADQAWNGANGDTAVFGAVPGSTAYNVTVSGVQSVGGLTFQSQAYTLTGNGGTLNLAGAAPAITVNAGGATIGSIITGSSGFTKSGTGMLALNAANVYSGGTTLSAGSLSLGNAAALGSGTLTFDNGNSGANTLLTTAVSFSNPITVNNGISGSQQITTTFNTANSTWSTGPININSGAALQVNFPTPNNEEIFGSTVTGPGSLTLSSTYPFSGNNRIAIGSQSLGNVALNLALGTFAAGSGSNLSGNDITLGPTATLIPGNNPSTGNATFGALNGSGIITTQSFVSSTTIFTVGNTNDNGTFSGRISGVSGYALAITKTGSGSQTLAGSGITYTGATTVSGGTLELQNTTGFASSSISNAATVQFDLNSSTVENYANVISGGGTLAKTSPGTLVLSASETYSGPTGAIGGALLLNAGTLQAASAVSVAGGATFGGNGSAGTAAVAPGGSIQGGYGSSGSLLLSALTFSGSGGVNIPVLANSYTSSSAINVSGVNALSTSGANSITINVGGFATAPPVNTVFELLAYNGSVGGSGTSAFQLGTLPSRTTGTLSDSGSFIDLTITGADFLHWSGSVSTAWDTTSPNWTLNSTGGTTTYIDSPGDTVVFDDRAGANSTVSIASAVHPSSVTFSNTASSYLLQGAGGIAGATGLTVNGAGLVTICTSNTYTGGTAIGGGTLQLGNGSSGNDGSINTTSSVTNNSVLAYNLYGSQTIGYAIGGSGSLYKTGAGMLTLTANNGYSGGTTVSQGTLQLNAAASAGSGTITLGDANTGASNVFLNINAASIANAIAVPALSSGSATINVFGNIANFNNAVTVNGPTTILGNGTPSNPNPSPTLSGTGTLTFNVPTAGGTQFILGGSDSSFTGNIVIASGTVFEPRSALSAAAGNNVTIQSGATMNVISFGNTTINGLDGAGTVTGRFQTGTLTVGIGNGSGTFSGTMQNGATVWPLVKSGAGAQILSGANIVYTGATTISGGTLELQNATGFASGSIANNATLQFDVGTGIAQIYTNVISGGGGAVVKTSPGLLVLGSANTYGGGTTISAGTVSAASIVPNGGASSLGNAVTPIVLGDNSANTGTLYYTGPSASFTPGLTVNSGGGNLVVANSGQTLALGGVSGSGPLSVAGAGNTTVSGPINSGITSFTAATGGTVTLSGNNGFSGSISVTSGALYLNGNNSASSISVAGGATLGGFGSAASASANVANGGILDFSQNTGSTFALAGLTFAGGATINVSDSGGQYAATPAVSTVSLSTSATINLNVSNVPFGVGSMQILQYSGAIGGAGSGVLNLASPVNSGRALYSLTSTNAGGSNYIDLNYSVDYPYWTGAGNLSWDTASTGNWNLTSNNGATTYEAGDNVVFDDRAITYSGTSAQIVNINSANVSPTSVTFGNTAASYTLQGAYGITGSATVTINGGGTVTIATSNEYTGGTTLSSGLLNLANSAALGSGPLTLGGGSLDNTSGAAMTLAGNNSQNWNSSFTFVGSSPLNMGSGAVTMNSSTTVYVAGSELTVGGAISGNGALTKNGPGLLLLTGSSSYSGATTISNGTLQLGTGQNGQDGSINGTSGVTNNGVLAYDLAGNQTAGYAIGGNGSLYKTGPGMLTLTASSTYAGATTLSQGTLQLNNAAGSGTITLGDANTGANNVQLVINSAAVTNSITVANTGTGTAGISLLANSDVISWGSGSSTYSFNGPATLSTPVETSYLQFNPALSGTGTLYVGNTNAAAGGWIILFTPSPAFTGNIEIENDATLEPRDILSAPGGNNVTVDAGGTLQLISFGNTTINALNGSGTVWCRYQSATLTIGEGNGSGTFSGTMTNYQASWSLIKAGTGTQVLSGANIGYTGATTVSGGVLDLQNATAFASSGITDNATLQFDVGASLTQSYSNTISGLGSVLVTSPGMLVLGGANGYSGGTTIDAGVLQLGNSAALGTGGLIANSGTLDLAGNSVTVSSFSGAAGTITNSAGGLATFTVNQPGNANQPSSTTFSGTINDGAGQVALVKMSTGTLTLSGTNSYSGGTTLSNGSIVVTNPASLGAQSGALSINSATLEVASGFSESRNITLTNNATIQVDPGQTYTNTGNISGDGETLNLTGAGTFAVAGSGYVSHTNVPAGTLAINGQLYSEVLDVTLSSGGTGQGSGQLSGTGTLTLGNDGMIYNSTAASEFAGTIASPGGGGLEVDGGTLTLSGTNTYSGLTQVDDSGVLILTNSEALAGGSSLTVGDASAFAAVLPALAVSSAAGITAVPEPDTLVLLAFGLWSAAIYRRFLKPRKS